MKTKQSTNVFLSSTTSDLHEFRSSARDCIDGLGLHCVWMEAFPANSSTPEDYIRRLIEQCELVVFLIGPCYGSLVPDRGLSYTELEYQIAKQFSKKCLFFFTTDDFPVAANVIIAEKNLDRQVAFRSMLQNAHVRKTFSRPDELRSRLAEAIHLDALESQELPPVFSPVTCVVLCGGKASRLAPLTRDTSKEAIPIAGKSSLERMLLKIDAEGFASSVIVSVGGDHEGEISELVQRVRPTVPVCVIANDCSGPLQALLKLIPRFAGEPFLLLAGDNLISASISSFVAYSQARNCSTNLLYQMPTGKEATLYGVGVVDEEKGMLRELREKKEVPLNILISTACYYFLNSDVLCLREFLNDDTVSSQNIGSFISWLLSRGTDISYCIMEEPWFDVGERSKLLNANAHFLRDRNDGYVEEGCRIKGPVIIENGAKVLENSVVGPFVYVGRDSVIDGGSEIRNSIIMDGAQVRNAIVLNSIIGRRSCIQGMIESFLVCNDANILREYAGHGSEQWPRATGPNC